MLDKAISVCEDEFAVNSQNCQLSTASGTPLKAESWQAFLSAEQSTIINISVRIVTTNPPNPPARHSREREYKEIEIVRRREPDPPPTRLSREREDEEIDIVRRRGSDPPAPKFTRTAKARVSARLPAYNTSDSSNEEISTSLSDDGENSTGNAEDIILGPTKRNKDDPAAPPFRTQTFTQEPEQIDIPERHWALVKRQSYFDDYRPSRRIDSPSQSRRSTATNERPERDTRIIPYGSLRSIHERRQSYRSPSRSIHHSKELVVPEYGRRRLTDEHRKPSDRVPGDAISPVVVNIHKLEVEENGIYFSPSQSQGEGSSSTTRVKDTVGTRESPASTSLGEPEGPERHPGGSLRPETVSAPMGQASRRNSTTIQPNVPPVFTWPTGKPMNSIPKSHPAATGMEKSDGAQGISNDPKDREPKVDVDQARIEEEVLKDVLNQIHTAISRKEGRKYETLLSASQEQVEKFLNKFPAAVKQAPKLEGRHATVNSGGSAWQVSMWQTFSILVELYQFFIPPAYPCEIREKYWGAVDALFTV